MTYQIDQSGKIEDTAKPTVLAYANNEVAAVLLKAREKRKLQELFRRHGKPALFVDFVFSAVLYLLIAPKLKKEQHTIFIIDIEYPGRTKIIENILQKLAKREIVIHWKLIGKNSKAHDIAYKVYKKKIKIAKILKAEAIWRLINKEAGGRLKIGLSPLNRRSAPATKKKYNK